MLGPVCCLNDRLDVFVKKKGKATRAPSHRVHLQLDTLNFSEGLEIFLKYENRSLIRNNWDWRQTFRSSWEQSCGSPPTKSFRSSSYVSSAMVVENDSESKIQYFNKTFNKTSMRKSQHQITDCLVNHRLERVHKEGLV